MDKKTATILMGLPQGRCENPQSPEDKLLLPDQCESLTPIRTAYLKNKYAGQTAYILTCGPSISEVWCDRLCELLADKLVITVKQAHELAPAISDFHLYNTVNLKKYEYPAPTIRVSIEKAPWMRQEYPAHLNYPISLPTIREHDVGKSLMGTNDYESWSLENSYERPWGIGIMFEFGLFLPIHLGCRRVLIIGFDMNERGKYHYYRNDESDASNYARSEEFVFSKSTIPHYLKWANARGVEVRQFSPLSDLPIPQVTDIYQWAQLGVAD